ncbi:hypothetical protein PFISCL1PPCAC_6856, partial [Pristionchus fissidentatus]
QVLKKTIWLEARGEPHEGQVGVAYVIKNRANANRDYWGGNTIAGVCLKPQQFECWNNRKPEDTHPKGEGYEDYDGWVKDVLDGKIGDPTKGAQYYNNPDKEGYPAWTNNVKKGVKSGNHQFYNE